MQFRAGELDVAEFAADQARVLGDDTVEVDAGHEVA